MDMVPFPLAIVRSGVSSPNEARWTVYMSKFWSIAHYCHVDTAEVDHVLLSGLAGLHNWN